MHLRLKTTSETESESASAEGSKEFRRIVEVRRAGRISGKRVFLVRDMTKTCNSSSMTEGSPVQGLMDPRLDFLHVIQGLVFGETPLHVCPGPPLQ